MYLIRNDEGRPGPGRPGIGRPAKRIFDIAAGFPYPVYLVSIPEPPKPERSEELRELMHRLRNPVAAIVGISDLLQDSALPAQQAEMVRMIRASAEQLLVMLEMSPTGGRAAHSAEPPPKPTSVRGLRLLLAEDDPATRFFNRTILTREGHFVDGVANGAEALLKLAAGRYDAVILDCRMPELDGYETARRVRAGAVAGLNPRLPIIALTAYSRGQEREKCLASGMDDCLEKPLRPEEMQAALARLGLARTPATSPAPLADRDAVLDGAHIQTMRSAPGRLGSSLLDDFMTLFYREEPKRIRALVALAKDGRFAELVRAAHTVAGSCAMLGARQLQQAALALENAASDGDPGEIGRRVDGIEAAWSRLCEALTEAGFAPPTAR